MKELKITNMRWPGGNYVMAYNWQDGIGPRNKRPARINLRERSLRSTCAYRILSAEAAS